MINLIKRGYAMTDLKPANTLFDPKKKQGKLIDLAGVF